MYMDEYIFIEMKINNLNWFKYNIFILICFKYIMMRKPNYKNQNTERKYINEMQKKQFLKVKKSLLELQKDFIELKDRE